jgi:CDP-2,3-bis-(O-geranylgeranyl)-sn-glycerol synthase
MGQILGLLVVANGAPIIARDVLGKRGDWPLDFGWLFCDGRPLFGPSKTIRGVVAAVGATGCAALLFGDDFATGAYVGLLAMMGDLLSSFLKRRLDIASSDSALGLDQGLEALVPVLVMQRPWDCLYRTCSRSSRYLLTLMSCCPAYCTGSTFARVLGEQKNEMISCIDYPMRL